MSNHSDRAQLGSRPARSRDFAVCIFVLAIGLLGWRAVGVFTSPPTQSATPALTALVETITGAQTTQIAITDTGAALILINGPENGLSAADAGKIRQFAATLSPNAPPPVIRQFEFAAGAPTRPDMAELAELALLGVLVILSGMLALARRVQSVRPNPAIVAAANDDRAQVSSLAPMAAKHRALSPASVSALPQSVDQAIKLANNNPQKTAQIIRQWMRQDETGQ